MNQVTIDLNALIHNFREIQKAVGPGCRIIAVVKSDAYGHGMVETAKVLASAGAWGFGLAEVHEVAILRQEGIRGVMLLMAGIYPGQEREAIELDADIAVYDRGQIDNLNRAASALHRRARVHVKVDTGMGRFGFTPEEALLIIRSRDNWPNLEFAGLFTHLSSADDSDSDLTAVQLSRLNRLIQNLKSSGWRAPLVHAANSAAIFNFPESHYHAVRPGIALYGAYPPTVQPSLPTQGRSQPPLMPVMNFTSKIASLKTLPPGSPVGYGHSHTTKRETSVAVIPVGYDNGYLRSLSNRGWVLVSGRRCPVIGNVCMRAIMIDVTGVQGVKVGSEAVLLGRQGEETITPAELALWAGTISYELLCLLGTKNPRVFKPFHPEKAGT